VLLRADKRALELQHFHMLDYDRTCDHVIYISNDQKSMSDFVQQINSSHLLGMNCETWGKSGDVRLFAKAWRSHVPRHLSRRHMHRARLHKHSAANMDRGVVLLYVDHAHCPVNGSKRADTFHCSFWTWGLHKLLVDLTVGVRPFSM